MRKAIYIIVLLLGSLTVFSQSEISFGLATKFQSKVSHEEWAGWEEPSAPILIYMDLGFGFLAIENGYHDRFILDMGTIQKTADSPSKTVYTLKAKDNTGKTCTLEFTYFASGNFALTIAYNDVHYSYWTEEENGSQGYPYMYFNSTAPQPTESPGIKSPTDSHYI